MGDWIAIAALVTSVAVALLAILRKGPVVSRSRLDDLLSQQAQLESRITQMTGENLTLHNRVTTLTARIGELLDDNEYWRRKFQESDEKLTRLTRRRTAERDAP